MTAKVVGKAVALKKGHYPDPRGRMIARPAGSTFDLLEGRPEKASWFERLPDAVAAKAEPVKAGKTKPPSADTLV